MINSGTELIKILIIEDDEAHSELIARSFEDHQTTFNLMFKTNLKESRFVTIKLQLLCEFR